MTDDFEIGRVVAVDTSQVTIELSPELRSFTRSTFEGVEEIGRINSYVVVPVGARRLVAMVTKVTLTEEAELRADRTMVSLPSAKRIMRATLIGSLEGRCFRQGVSTFPILDNPVLLAGNDDLDAMFDSGDPEEQDPTNPGYCVEIGESAVLEGHSVKIDPDAMFGKHLAVLGSTGSGKSCTVATIIQAILEQPQVKRTNFIILDTNGEYRAAFQRVRGEAWEDFEGRQCLYVPSSPDDPQHIAIPYWFLDSDDFVRLFRAKEGLQAPVLLRALRLARAGSDGSGGVLECLEVLRTTSAKIVALAHSETASQLWAIPKNILELCEDGLRYRESFPAHAKLLTNVCGEDVLKEWEDALVGVKSSIEALKTGSRSGEPTYSQIGPVAIQSIQSQLQPVLGRISALLADASGSVTGTSPDQPTYFERSNLAKQAMDTAMREQAESTSPARIREACGPMLLRISRFVEDPRFRFLFANHPQATHALAAFLRDVLGLESCDHPQPPLSGIGAVPKGALPFYDRQRCGAGPSHVVILDLSLLASEVLDNVTALIGRLVLEFLERLGETGQDMRGKLPVVMVLDEAQNYIGDRSSRDDESIARAVFERVAREGRKFGLGLVVASQRPSELSKTVLSQCSSFIVHRLQNPEDLRYFREVVPAIYGDLLGQLPALAPQTALVLGECVRAPALVRMRDADPLPRSKDPRFYESWVSADAPSIDVERICADWEGVVEPLSASGDWGEGRDQEPEPTAEPPDVVGDYDDIPF